MLYTADNQPRCFGKSLWCFILECYYGINRRERFETLFGATDIGRAPTATHNSQLVLRFDFSRVEMLPDYEALRRKFNAECRNGLRIFP